MALASVIHFCTNDLRFLRRCVEEAKKFSHRVIIPVCDHFFNGDPEDRQKLHWIYREFSDCTFIEFAYDFDRLYSPFPSIYSSKDRGWAISWHSTSRLIGELFTPPDCDYLLFLDTDEIADGDGMKKWFETKEHLAFSAIRFGCYVYQRHNVRAREYFTCALLVQRSALDPLLMLEGDERTGLFEQISGNKCYKFDFSGAPFFHHYTWVRTKPECLKKADTWGHKYDGNWKSMIERFFEGKDQAAPMNMKLTWAETTPIFDPLSVEEPLESVEETEFSNVRKVGRAEAVKLMLERSLATH